MIINESIDNSKNGKGGRNSRLFKIRNILNLIFILTGIAGVAIYFLASHSAGTIVILVGCVIKFIECCLRLIR